MTQREIDRRRALVVLGSTGLGAAVLGACGGSNGGDRSQPGDTAAGNGSASTTGSPGTTAASSPSGALTAESFKDAAACRVTPQQTEGPFYIDVDQIRGDIREDRPGTRLRVAARVVDVNGCTPIRDAVFEIWHCDAGGIYSGFEQASRGAGGRGPGGGGGVSGGTDSSRFLRGGQVTNADGIAEITTIYPGWYQGRTTHIHAKVLLSGTDELTTQLYFDDALNRTVYGTAPYSERGEPDMTNRDDGIYREETTLTVSKDGDGYLGLITIGIAP